VALHVVASAELNRTHSRGFYDPNAYVLANWGELAMAAAFALVTCLAAATLIASTLPGHDRGQDPAGTPLTYTDQIGSGLLAAVALGLTVGGLYAIGASVYFDLVGAENAIQRLDTTVWEVVTANRISPEPVLRTTATHQGRSDGYR
jgi:hypothetical protein